MTCCIHVGGAKIYVIIGFYDNQQPSEVFLKGAKFGNTLSGMLDTISILFSFCLQANIAWGEIKNKLENTKYAPSDETYSSVMDAVVKEGARMISTAGGFIDYGHEGRPEKAKKK